MTPHAPTVEVLEAQEAEDRQRRVAGSLIARGCRVGDRVVFCLGSSADLICAVLGAARIGVIPVLLNATLTEADQTPDHTTPAFDQFNKIMREHYQDYGYTGYLDFHSVLALTPDSDLWKPGLSGDGTHFSRTANPLLYPIARKVLGEGK